jgi:hypothetical protein
VFTSVPHFELWTEHWNDDPEPFVWHKQAQDIIAKVKRERAALHQIKSATPHQTEETKLRATKRMWNQAGCIVSW